MRVLRYVLVAVCFFICAGSYAVAGNNNVQLPPWPFSPTITHNAVVVNLYMSTQWDGLADFGERQASIDSFTSALINSSYFAQLNTDYGIGTPTFAGGFVAPAGCPTPPVAGTLERSAMIEFVACSVSTPPIQGIKAAASAAGSTLLVNLFIPNQQSNVQDGNPTNNEVLCPTDVGYHFDDFIGNLSNGQFGDPFTILPTSANCNGDGSGHTSFASLANTESHEMAEALTDPVGLLGWTQRIGVLGLNVSQDTGSGEVGDICNNGSAAVVSDQISFLTVNVQFYWSNGAQHCVPSWPITQPTIRQLSITHDAVNMYATVQGSAFGILPPGLPPGNSPYFRFIDTTNGLDAGNSLDSLASKGSNNQGSDLHVGTITSWFGGGASSMTAAVAFAGWINSCDLVTANIFNPSDGSMAASPVVMVPGPTSITISGAPAVAQVGSSPTIQVQVNDGSGYPLVSPTTLVMTLDGVTVGTWSTNQVAQKVITISSTGTHTLSASTVGCPSPTSLAPPVTQSTTIIVPPIVTALSQYSGPASGGAPVKIFGIGLAGASTITFGGQPAQITHASANELDVITPPHGTPPFAGPAYVVVAVNGISSNFNAVAPTYTYFFADSPLLRLLPLNGQLGNCPNPRITLTEYGSADQFDVGAQIALTVAPPATIGAQSNYSFTLGNAPVTFTIFGTGPRGALLTAKSIVTNSSTNPAITVSNSTTMFLPPPVPCGTHPKRIPQQ